MSGYVSSIPNINSLEERFEVHPTDNLTPNTGFVHLPIKAAYDDNSGKLMASIDTNKLSTVQYGLLKTKVA